MLTSPEQATAQSTYDDIWRFAEWYRNDGNETVQSVLLSGGFQYEFAAVGADQGRASDVFALTVGKQGVPFTMDGSTSSKELLTIDRSNLRKQMDRIPVTVLQRMLDACDRPGRPDFRSLCLQECRVTVLPKPYQMTHQFATPSRRTPPMLGKGGTLERDEGGAPTGCDTTHLKVSLRAAHGVGSQ